MAATEHGRFTPAAPLPVPLPSSDLVGKFADRNAETYRRHYEGQLARHACRKRAGRAERLPFLPSWSWPAFLATLPWLFYRKMYLGGIILVALPVFLDHLLPNSLFLGSGLLIATTAGICGKSWYVEHAVRRIAKASREYPDRPMRHAYLARASGVSLSAGIFGALIQIVTGVVLILGLLPSRFWFGS